MFDKKIKLNEKNKYTHLRDCDFIKSRLLSKHHQFRTDIQYLFFLLNNHNLRQLNAGIYQTMHVINPRLKYAADEFLKKLVANEAEHNLNTIFARLPNTEQYWKKLKCDIQCMIDHYGPPHIFLTMSTRDWN